MARRREKSKLPFGKVKTLAHRMLAGEPIPIFADNGVNRAIDAHARRIRDAQTKRGPK
jgi:hypothetical protein